jgi:hypothetical protein
MINKDAMPRFWFSCVFFSMNQSIEGFLSNSADQPLSAFSSGVNNKQQNPPKEGFDRIGYLDTN